MLVSKGGEGRRQERGEGECDEEEEVAHHVKQIQRHAHNILLRTLRRAQRHIIVIPRETYVHRHPMAAEAAMAAAREMTAAIGGGGGGGGRKKEGRKESNERKICVIWKSKRGKTAETRGVKGFKGMERRGRGRGRG